ncbi:MAG: protein-L-isoaspartate(D-aspartate) O-methyltransferase [Rhodospirillales bacterium]|nr:protein-L-isoaspartate(D-aspartate) O-methyltransferase [Rhodospirillales bacterium]
MSNAPPPDPEKLNAARQRLLVEIAATAAETANWTGRQAFSDAVMAAMARVPRHEFVDPDSRAAAYANRPQPIGHGQTISQPYIVALMSDLLDLVPTDRVLEIGTGCGYQAAVLAELAGHVYSIETLEKLATPARARLKRLGYDNVTVQAGDGFLGWPEEAPFDAIIVTAAPERIPDALVDQLANGGRLVIPIGPQHETQFLVRLIKDQDGAVTRQDMLPVAFVPMVRKGA